VREPEKRKPPEKREPAKQTAPAEPARKREPARRAAPADPAEYVCPVCQTSEVMAREHHALTTERQRYALEGGLKAPLDLRQKIAALDEILMRRQSCHAPEHDPPARQVAAWREHLAAQPRPEAEGQGPPAEAEEQPEGHKQPEEAEEKSAEKPE
jgi:hypothetical protein